MGLITTEVAESARPSKDSGVDPDRLMLETHRAAWAKNPALRRVYESYFQTILDLCGPQRPIIELGTGPGFLKAFCPEIIATDITPTPWLDAVVDGCQLPFKSESAGNIVMMDVFHHIARPLQFLDEASRVLALGGRIVMLEPWTSPLGYLFYRHIHHEGADRHVDPLRPFAHPKEAFDGNAAIPEMFFSSPKGGMSAIYRDGRLRLESLKPFPAASWLLTGGFRSHGLPPAPLVPLARLLPLARCLDVLLTPISRWCALRATIVLVRTAGKISTHPAADLQSITLSKTSSSVFPTSNPKTEKA